MQGFLNQLGSDNVTPTGNSQDAYTSIYFTISRLETKMLSLHYKQANLTYDI